MQTLTELRSKIETEGYNLRRSKVVGVGLGVLNYTGIIKDWNDTSKRGHLRNFFIEGGGMAHSAAVAASHLGAESSVLSVFAKDNAGKRIAEDLKRHNINIGNCIWDSDGVSGISLVIVDGSTGESNQLIRSPNHRENILNALELELLRTADSIIIDSSSTHLFEIACRFLKQLPTSQRPHVVIDTDKIALLDNCPPGSVIVLPIYSLKQGNQLHNLAKAARELIQETRAITVIITSGESGGIIASEKEVSRFYVPQITAVDTTGAGDVFHGVLAAFLGAAAPIRNAVLGAAVAATLKCTNSNGRSGFPNLSQILTFLYQKPDDAFHLENFQLFD